MTETYPSDAQLNDLSGTSDPEQEVLFIPTGESPYYTSFYKMLFRLLSVARRAGDLRVYKDGALTFGVRAGKYFNGDAEVNYAGSTENALTNNDTNYVYLTAAGTLTVNLTGFPTPSVTAHIPLATITTSAGDYSINDGDIVDYRGRAMFQICGAAAGSLNLLDWQESLADELDFTAAEPAAPSEGDRYLNTGTGTSSETSQSVTANYIYQWNGSTWTEIVPTEGACCMVEDRDMLIGYNGSAWVDIGTLALWNEAQAFFAATDITGAEAETLTDGSNADSKHVHDTAGLTADCVDKTIINSDVAGSGLEQHTDGTLRIAAAAAGDGLSGGAGSALAVNVDDSTIEINTDTLRLKDAGITAAKLAAAVQDLLPNLNVTSGGEVGDTHTVTIQARDAANNNLAERVLVRLWVDDAEYGAPDATGNTVAVTTGTTYETETANAAYKVISDANGTVVVTLAVAGSATRYVMAEIDGRIYSSGALTFTA